MTRLVRVLALTSSMLTLAAFAAAQAPTTPAATKSTAAAAKKPAKAAASQTSLVAVGKLAKFDASSNMLTVTTATGDVMLTVTPTTKITEGSKAMKVADLSAASGKNVRVSYMDKDGTKTVSSIKVTTAAAPAAAKTTTKKK
jgi:hypothetical protein